jgi:hypothetical protein
MVVGKLHFIYLAVFGFQAVYICSFHMILTVPLHILKGLLHEIFPFLYGLFILICTGTVVHLSPIL